MGYLCRAVLVYANLQNNSAARDFFYQLTYFLMAYEGENGCQQANLGPTDSSGFCSQICHSEERGIS